MSNPIKFKSFEMFLEEVNNVNSDRMVRLKDYKTKVDKYNKDKLKFKPIFTSKKEETWEAEANKIIMGNVYLALTWKIAKMTYEIENMNTSMKSKELSDVEVADMQEKIRQSTRELNKEKIDFQKKLKEDLKAIQED